MEQKKHIKLPSVDPKEFHYKPKTDILRDRLLTPQISTHSDFSEYCVNSRRGSLNQKLPSLEKNALGSSSASPATPFSSVNIGKLDLSPRFKVRQPVFPDTKMHESRVKTSINALRKVDEPKEIIEIIITNPENPEEKNQISCDTNQLPEKPQTAQHNFQRFKYNRHQKGRELKSVSSACTFDQTDEDNGILDI